MPFEKIAIGGIPAIVWGAPSDKAYIHVHGKMSRKEEAREFAEIACSRGYQVVSFDLPEHGERTDPEYKCDIWNGVRDLTTIHDYARSRWNTLSLFGCSLGACFSLFAFKDARFEKCLFHSPVLDMERLIRNMMTWFGTNEAELKERQEIPTPIGETLSWKYYTYVKENRVTRWSVPTRILCGTNDNLTEQEVFEDFARRFHCELEIVENGNHYFTTESELAALRDWYRRSI